MTGFIQSLHARSGRVCLDQMSCLQHRLVQQDYFFFQTGVPFWDERGVFFTIRHAVQESEVDHVAAVWSEDP